MYIYRWKEARRDKRKRERAGRRTGGQDAEEEGEEKEEDNSAGEPHKGGKRKKKEGGKGASVTARDIKALEAKAAQAGQDQLADFVFSSDDEA